MNTDQTSFIVHIDMDAFFASIEQHDDPSLRGKPVIVGADPKKGHGRGVVSTCSYEARAFGIHSAMPISIAYRRCPHGIFIQPDMDKYASRSNDIYTILYRFTPDIESVGIDEAFLDITHSYHLFNSPHNTCFLIKKEIFKKTGLTASIGMAPTKMIAKIASDLNKPDGCVFISRDDIETKIWPLPVDKIWGVGKKAVSKMHSIGIFSIGDLANTKLSLLQHTFGNAANYFNKCTDGMNFESLKITSETKSISNELTFETDTNNNRLIIDTLMHLVEKVSNRLRAHNLKGKTIALKIRLEGFDTYTRSITLDTPTNYFEDIYMQGCLLLDQFEHRNKKIRLLGVKVSQFVTTDMKNTFFDFYLNNKRENIHRTVDSIKQRFGFNAINRGRVCHENQ